MVSMQGLVCSIERFATHDGPGIRTLVYMKGCPLNCLWCSSPHTRQREPEILFSEARCARAGACVAACPEQALHLSAEEGLRIDRDRCNVCGLCLQACNNRAFEISAAHMTVDSLFKEIQKDSPFYRRSNGGVTVGGGELTMQSPFVSAFLKKCQEQYIHTAIETCGFSNWSQLQAILQYVDLIHLDIKHMDEEMHRKLTGFPNQPILENAKKASHLCSMIVRIPVIPGLNDSDENIRATARFAAQLGDGFQRIELLPYHQLGMHKYEQLGQHYELEGLQSPDADHMLKLKAIVASEGIGVEIVA